jgi:hypothetical protein
MDMDVEDLLRQGMERSTRDVRAPAGIARRILRRRRRRLALRSAAGSAAALAACTVALVTVELPGPAVSAAYVVTRVNSALSAAEPGAIAQMTITTSGPVPVPCSPGVCRIALGTTATTTAEEWSYGDQWRAVTYSSAGHPAYDEGFSTSSGYTLVSYATRTWTRQRGLGHPAPFPSGPRGCESLIASLPLLFQAWLPAIGLSASSPPATVARALRTAVSCGTLQVAGHQRVDGIEAIELTSRPGSLLSETIWVSPGTYLPVRVIVSWDSGFAGTPAPAPGESTAVTPVLKQTADITWLPPTAQNLAKLTVPIPSGFRHVSLVQAVTPNLPRFPVRQLPDHIVFCPSPGPAAMTGRGYASRLRALTVFPLTILRLRFGDLYRGDC